MRADFPAELKYSDVAANPDVRTAMRALVATGHYPETPDAFEWLWRDAVSCVTAIEQDGSYGSVAEALGNAGLHDVTDPDELACLLADAFSVTLSVVSQ